MDSNTAFFSGIACGFCLCALIFNRRRIFRLGAATKTNSAINNVKQEAPRIIDESDEYKLVLVVRSDLKMGKGKVAAQCAHAAVGAYSKALKHDPEALKEWEYTGQAKIALKVDTEAELIDIYNTAKRAGLTTSLIRDAGRTQIAPNTKTVLGIGPASKSAIDSVTGHLKLF